MYQRVHYQWQVEFVLFKFVGASLFYQKKLSKNKRLPIIMWIGEFWKAIVAQPLMLIQLVLSRLTKVW
jgi:hypothetical protein